MYKYYLNKNNVHKNLIFCEIISLKNFIVV